LEISLTREIWRLRHSNEADGELARVYQDDYVGNVEWMGVPTLQLMTCGTGFKHFRAAVLRRFFPGHAEQASFSEFQMEIYSQQQFSIATRFPRVIQARHVSPRALRQIAQRL